MYLGMQCSNALLGIPVVYEARPLSLMSGIRVYVNSLRAQVTRSNYTLTGREV